jgi:hypothetical protein
LTTGQIRHPVIHASTHPPPQIKLETLRFLARSIPAASAAGRAGGSGGASAGKPGRAGPGAGSSLLFACDGLRGCLEDGALEV